MHSIKPFPAFPPFRVHVDVVIRRLVHVLVRNAFLLATSLSVSRAVERAGVFVLKISLGSQLSLAKEGRGSVMMILTSHPASGAPFPSLSDVTIEDLQHGFEQGCFTSVDLVQAYLERIHEVNGDFHAVTKVNPDALVIAQSLDAERASGKLRGPLHGIPILLKNNIATMDKMNNRAGSYALLGATVPRDSTITKKLREAGVIILGKANLSQWASQRSANSNNSWSSHGGQVYAAYYPRQDPSGSSSGSAVAANLGLALATIGTKTAGFILSPAGYSNVVGIKPTVGLTSRYLVIPISEHQDTIGPMARTVRDAAYILQAIAGQDRQDNYTSAIQSIPDYVGACDSESLNGARIGVPWNLLMPNPSVGESENPVLEAFKWAIEVLRNAGAIVVDANFTLSDSNLDLEADFVVNLAEYLDKLTFNPHAIHTLAQLRDFTRRTPIEEYPDRDTATWDTSLDDGMMFNNTNPRFWSEYQSILRSAQTEGILHAMDEYDLTAVTFPTTEVPGLIRTIGAPGVSVPIGFYLQSEPVETDLRGDVVTSGPGIPFGMSFLGRRWSEAHLIGLACEFERRAPVRGRMKPMSLPKAEVHVSDACKTRSVCH